MPVELLPEKAPTRRVSVSEKALKMARRRNYTPLAKGAARVAALSAKPPDGPGLSIAQIAKRLRISTRQVSNLRAAARELAPDGTGIVYVPEPVAVGKMNEAVRATVAAGKRWLAWVQTHPGALVPDEVVEPAAVAFEAFYTRYSGLYMPEHWRLWVRAALRNDRLLLNVPPGHAKSELFSVWLPIWFVCLDRNIQILIVSESVTLAKKFAVKIAWNLEWHPRLIPEQGRFRPDNEAAPWRPLSGELLVHGRGRQVESGDLTLQIRGSGQQILGMRADIIVGDDVVGRDSAGSQNPRDKLSEYWHGDVMSRLSPVSRVWVIGQRIHFMDLYGELAEKVDEETGLADWHHIVMPAIESYPSTAEDGSVIPAKVLWEREWPYKRLMKARRDLTRRAGAALFETMYQQNPLPAAGVTVRPEWIEGTGGSRGCLDRDRGVGTAATIQRLLGLPDDAEVPEQILAKSRLVRVMTLDPPQERAGGLIIEDVLEDREVFTSGILEVHRLRPGIQEVHRLVREKAGFYNPDYLIIEQNGAQRWFKEDPAFVAWHRRTNIRLLPHATGQNKQNPDWGLQSLSVDFEMGRIRLPYGDADSRAMSNLLIEEVTKHPYGDYDDIFMALWFAKFNLPKLISIRRNERDPRKPTPTFHSPPRLRKGWKAFART